jgi:hypothetical protein
MIDHGALRAIAATWTLACGSIVFVLALASFWQTEEGPPA